MGYVTHENPLMANGRIVKMAELEPREPRDRNEATISERYGAQTSVFILKSLDTLVCGTLHV